MRVGFYVPLIFYATNSVIILGKLIFFNEKYILKDSVISLKKKISNTYIFYICSLALKKKKSFLPSLCPLSSSGLRNNVVMLKFLSVHPLFLNVHMHI